MPQIVFNIGMGTQSTIFLLSEIKQLREKSEILMNLYEEYKSYEKYYIFADTGAEKPETIAYLEYLQEKKLTDKLIIVDNGNIYDYYKGKKTIPVRSFRSCTENFKIRPIRTFVRENLRPHRKHNVILNALGITTDEFHRMKDNPNKYAINVFPLIDLDLSRDDVLEVYDEVGLERPGKSGCWFCPFQKKQDWIDLRKEHFKLSEKAIDLELIAAGANPSKNITLYSDKISIRRLYDLSDRQVTLEDIFLTDEERKTLDQYDEDECSGSCFT